MKLYLDSSAIVKLIQRERESAPLQRYLRRKDESARVTSTLARVEVVRAVLPGGPAAVAHAHRQLGRMFQIALDAELLDDAAVLEPGARVRSLDAIHLASAKLLGPELEAIVTYDERMADAAARLALPVTSPR